MVMLDNFTSVLKIHAAGYLAYQTGNITDRGIWVIIIGLVITRMQHLLEHTSFFHQAHTPFQTTIRLAGFSVRCIKRLRKLLFLLS